MPIINFTEPFYLLTAIVLFVLCLFLGRNNKSNTVPCIMLLTFLAILVGHSIELTGAATSEEVAALTKCFAIDEAFIFISFLSFLWTDRIQIEKKEKASKGKKTKDVKPEDKTYKDGLDFLWKKV